MFTDQETLRWIKGKIAGTGLAAETNRDLYGAMHVLVSGWEGMERYVKAYRCEEKQGMIANLSVNLQQAIDRLEATGEDCADYRATLGKTDEVLGCRWSETGGHDG